MRYLFSASLAAPMRCALVDIRRVVAGHHFHGTFALLFARDIDGEDASAAAHCLGVHVNLLALLLPAEQGPGIH